MVDIVLTNAKEVSAWLGNVHKSIGRAEIAFLGSSMKEGKRLMKEIAPRGVRGGTKSLRESAVSRIFNKTKMAKLHIRPDNEVVGLANEFGVRRHFVTFAEAPNLRRWAMKKYRGYNPSMTGLFVGGPNSALGNQNKFWIHIFTRLSMTVPQRFAGDVSKIIQGMSRR